MHTTLEMLAMLLAGIILGAAILVLLEHFCKGFRAVSNARIRQALREEVQEVKARFQESERLVLVPLKKRLEELHTKVDSLKK